MKSTLEELLNVFFGGWLNKEQINISFGIGIIKKRILVSDIDFDSIQKFKINWYYGIGIRLLKDGWLYNTKAG